MISIDVLNMCSALLVAVPTVRAACRILLARHKTKKAGHKQNALPALQGQRRQTQALEIDLLRNEAHDLIEFSTLVPTWALSIGLLGLVLNIVARAIPLFT